MKLRDLLDTEGVEVEEDRQVVKSIPAKAEWIEKRKELLSLEEKHNQIHREMQSKKNAMWAAIDIEVNDYCDKRYNAQGDEIEFLAPPTDNPSGYKMGKGKPINSPLQNL